MSVSLIDGHIDDDVMTDEQIIKALECCSGNTMDDCEDCPRCCDDVLSTPECMCKLMRDALDLINRQKAENERSQNIIKVADKTIELQSAEISAERNLLEEAESELARLNVVIDRLVKERVGE
jgi:hypothetical protein